MTTESVRRNPAFGVDSVNNTIAAQTDSVVVQAGVIAGDVRLSSPVRAAVVPRQLPQAPLWFTGRELEQATLTAVLGRSERPPGRPMVAAVVGAGGIGKTWLTLNWAHRHLDRFPDGQIYLDLRGLGPAAERMTLGTAVRCLLDALGVAPCAVPADVDSQLGRYRSLVVGRRILIVLDNARDAAQVAALLPGSPSCTVLVTSRSQLDGLIVSAGAHRLVLTEFTESEACRMFAERLGEARVTAEPAATAALLEYCAGLPLALGIVVSRAIAQPTFPLAALASELCEALTRVQALDSGDPATSLDSVLSWSYHALSEAEARIFRLLGLVPGPDISLPAAASLAALPVHTVRATLRALERMSLVHQRQPDRWQMHVLVHLYAANQSERVVGRARGEAAVRRLADFYVHAAYAADRILHPDRRPTAVGCPPAGCPMDPVDDSAAALAWFDAEHANLMAVLRLAVARGWHRTVWQLAWALHSFHWQRARIVDQVAGWRAGLAAARHLGDEAGCGLAHRLLGAALSRAGGGDEALEHLHSALQVSIRVGDPLSEGETHRSLARVWERRGEYDVALTHAFAALRLFRRVGESRNEADALDLVCWLQARLGRLEDAKANGAAALALYRRCQDPDGEATALDTMGYLAHLTGRYAQARDYYVRALGLFRGRNVYHEASTLHRLGEAHLVLGDREQAGRAWRRALQLLRTQQRLADAERVRQRLADLEPSSEDAR